MDRQDLEQKNRDELIAQAKVLGLSRPEVLTKNELIDEILRREIKEPEKKARARGLLGRARDLLAEIVGRGLHLPEAAERIRASTPPPQPDAPPAVATVTLAEIYAAQGHAKRALDVLEQVLSREPDHAVALALKQKWLASPPTVVEVMAPPPPRETRDAAAVLDEEVGSSDAVQPAQTRASRDAILPPSAPVELSRSLDDLPDPLPSTAVDSAAPDHPGGPIPMLDDVPLPPRYDVDEAVVMPVDPTTAYVYWEVRPRTVARTRSMSPGGSLVVRVFAATDQGITTRDIVTDAPIGDYFVFGLPDGATLQVLLGWLVGDALEPLAFGPPYSAPPASPVRRIADTIVQWTPEQSTIVQPPPLPSPMLAVDLALALARAVSGEDAKAQAENPAFTLRSPEYVEPELLVPTNQFPTPTFTEEDLAPQSTSPLLLVHRTERTIERRARRWVRVEGPLGSSDLLWSPIDDVDSETVVDDSIEQRDQAERRRRRRESPSSPMGASDLWQP